jgi:hypothetical protein
MTQMPIDPDSIAEDLAGTAETFLEIIDAPAPVLEDYPAVGFQIH